MSRNAVRRLIDNFTEMQYRLMKYGGGQESMMFYDEMRMVIKDLCMEIDDPELYERFVMNSENGMMFRKEKLFTIFNDNEKDIEKK